MEKFKLNNGATIVIAECSSKELSVSVTVNVGHVNEPKLGIAALYENVLMKQVSRVQTVYGGTVTSFFTGCEKEELEMTMSKMANLIKAPHLGSDLIQAAAFDIVEHTRDLAPLVKRQMKLLYKHTAFGKKRVLWDAESYINAIESYGAPDLKEFADKYYTGKNLVVVVAGGHVGKDEVKTLAEKYFGDIPAGERQRVQLARAVRNRTTGVLYVLDEPSIGLHPSNIVGLNAVMHDLIADGNSIILVDHDTQILSEADWLIEMGPEAGAGGGYVITQGTIPQVIAKKESMIGPFLAQTADMRIRKPITREEIFAPGKLHLSTDAIHTVKPLEIDIPKGRLTVVTGVSGSGKTTMVLESLIPGLEAKLNGEHLPGHVKSITAEGIAHVKLIDASPIGINVRSTVATYANVHDELRKIYAKTADAKNKKYKAGVFSYNTGKLRCPVCDGTGQISLDVQFLPDVDVPCPECGGSRYARESWDICYENKRGKRYSLPQMMEMDVTTALQATEDWKVVHQRLEVLKNLGLGYLTLGEETPSLSGGEAQRLKLASEMGRGQSDSVFVFDEPTIGLHPLDVQTLLQVFQTLVDNGATVLVIEHDLDVIRNADYIIDMGPGGGEDGGRVVAVGTLEQIKADADSITGKYL